MSTVEDLTRRLTIDECQGVIYETLAARGARPTTWKPGAVVRTLIYGLAIICSALSALVASLARSAFLDLSSGAWLTLVARYVYGVERLEGTFASGAVVASNAGAGVYSGDPDDLIFVNPTTGKEYRNSEPFSIAAFEPNVSIPVRAVEIGTGSNAGAGQITELATPLLGVTVTNPTTLIGTDPETDAALRARCRDKLGTLSPNGPRDAYRFIATTAETEDGEPVGVTRVKTVPDGYGNIAVYVATASGAVPGDAEDPGTDLGAVAKAIWEQTAPLGVTPIVQSASAETIAVTYELWLPQTTLTNPELEEIIEAYLGTWMSTLPIGGIEIDPDPGRIYVSAVKGAIAQALAEQRIYPIRIEVTAPASDVDLAENEAPVLGAVEATGIHQIQGDA